MFSHLWARWLCASVLLGTAMAICHMLSSCDGHMLLVPFWCSTRAMLIHARSDWQGGAGGRDEEEEEKEEEEQEEEAEQEEQEGEEEEGKREGGRERGRDRGHA